ncbi:hypothetical protein H6F86_01195 [Phormidium sp. FACHB-592]|uniref:Secreted protein n=1 Tax=Stenomitos frigidus AS-A4 TaxID=2933935 RepID=A0ABV0KQI5_9CYAN|nr:hypothetical protein [Phormidium sp. FACHB-592]MBD2072551.1 hypothetical protein [Phormidium sp. FACHB-592]
MLQLLRRFRRWAAVTTVVIWLPPATTATNLREQKLLQPTLKLDSLRHCSSSKHKDGLTNLLGSMAELT